MERHIFAYFIFHRWRGDDDNRRVLVEEAAIQTHFVRSNLCNEFSANLSGDSYHTIPATPTLDTLAHFLALCCRFRFYARAREHGGECDDVCVSGFVRKFL